MAWSADLAVAAVCVAPMFDQHAASLPSTSGFTRGIAGNHARAGPG